VLGAVMNGVDLKSFRNRKYYYRSERYSSYYHRYGKSGERLESRSAFGLQKTPTAIFIIWISG
jgi:hypothetical protein